MATRTAKGTNTAKNSALTLSLTSVEVLAGHSLVVGVANQGTSGPSSATWGPRTLNRIGQRIDTPNTFMESLFLLRAQKTFTRDIDFTWTATANARSMFAFTLDGLFNKDDDVRSLSAATGAPSVGPTSTLSSTAGFAVGMFTSQGPSGDTAGSASSGWTLGQRAGTAGAPPTGNITFQEVYQDLSASTALSASLSGATSRDWANLLVPLRPVVPENQVLYLYGQQYADLLGQVGGDDAIKVYMMGLYNDQTLPATPPTEWLTDLGMDQTAYSAAITLLEDCDVIETVVAGVMTPKGFIQ